MFNTFTFTPTTVLITSCYLMAPASTSEGSAEAADRLRVLEQSHSGMRIAEADLKLR